MSVAIFGVFDGISRRGAWLLGLALVAPIAGQIWATLARLQDSDEFVRALFAKRFIAASGLSMAVPCVWGYLESYADAPHIPGRSIYPLFWAAFGVDSPFIRTSR